MNLRPYIESVRKIFPGIGFTEIILQFDVSQKKFCRETKILKYDAELDDVDSEISWDLPSDFLELYRVDYYNSDDDPLYNVFIDWEIEHDTLYAKSTTLTVLDGRLTEGIDSCIINYYRKPTGITSLTSSWTVDEDYRDYVKSDVLAELYSSNRIETLDRNGKAVFLINSREADRHAKKYRDGVIKTKRQKNMNGDNRPMVAENYDFAGKVYQPKRQKPASTGSTLAASTVMSTIFSKYVQFTAENPSTLTETAGKFGFSGAFIDDFTAITDGDTLVLTSASNDFTDGVTQVVITNGDAEHKIDSPTQMTFTFWDAWSTVTFELWER